MSTRANLREILSRFPIADGIFRRFIWSRLHFPEIEMRVLQAMRGRTFDVSIDVGAALGSYAWILNRISKNVYAFEPGSVHYGYLKRLLWGTNIELVRAAAGSSCGGAILFLPSSDRDGRHSATLMQGGAASGGANASGEQVEQITLDAFFSQRLGVGRTIDFLKVDVEGYELEVFKGAEAILSSHHPLVVCEIEARHNPGYREVFMMLRAHGYASYFFRGEVLEPFTDSALESLQLEKDLEDRTSAAVGSSANRYINNFIFQHPQSRIKVTE